MKKIIEPPFTDALLASLKAGEMYYITGTIYTARDAAHQRLCEMIERGEDMPFDFNGQAVYYAGPCPAKPGQPIGSVGPTTGGRMDAYSPLLISKGLKVMIGKGSRHHSVVDAMKKHTGVYFAAIGGAAALMGKSVKSAKVIAFEDLGPEAIRELYVEELPVIVAIDSRGNNSYEQGMVEYAQE
ncbi:fumarate hydratase [Porphyromonas canoris]|uniref:Fe-S-containing hydro-lyase n=1 Tax=Porphyromonas canoris TaxID=36875 RepID=UPI00051DF1D2|nr:Fe-S-containing hydro-lyase [Porphyromonas canoris]KGL52923.1 fumarate hydratase [Porphyromonas canoris]